MNESKAERLFDDIMQAVIACMTDLDHGDMVEVGASVLGYKDPRVIELASLIEVDVPDSDRQGEVMEHAQMDLVASVRYATGQHDSYSIAAAIRTVIALAKFTGIRFGEDLYHIVGE